MKELDLDELDQAVSKLMTDAGKPKPKKEPAVLAQPATTPPPADEPAPAPAPAPDPAPPADPPKEEDDDKVAVNVSSSASSQPLQITPRKKGVAMDIVRPQAGPVAPPSERAARTAPTLQPTKPIEPEEPAKDEPVKEEVKEEPKPDEPQPATHEVSDDTKAAIDLLGKPAPEAEEDHDEVHKSAWPDPLEVHGFKEEPAHKDVDEPETTKEEKQPTMEHHAVIQPTDGTEKTDEKPADDEPQEDKPDNATPFVTTQVEKRPLGAYADKPAEEPAKEEPEEKLEDTPKTEQASVPVQESPKELSPEVVAVESAEPEFTPEVPEAEEAKEEPKEEKATDMNNLRQMSIPQQYQEEQKVPSEAHRPVFDTKEYHPPLQIAEHAQHKPHRISAFTIVLIVLILAALVVGYFIATGSIDISRLL